MGLLDEEEVLNLFTRLQSFTISRTPGENTCLPSLLTLGSAGFFGFAMSEIGLFNFETSSYIAPSEALALAFGHKNPDLYSAQQDNKVDTKK